MEFLKNFFSAAVKFAYSVFVAPIVEVKDILSKTLSEKIVTLLNAASRVIIIGSWFFAVPVLLVTLAWVWFWLSLVVALVYIATLLLSGAAGVAIILAAAAQANESSAETTVQDAAPAAA